MRYTEFIVGIFLKKYMKLQTAHILSMTIQKHTQDKTECCFHRLFNMEEWHVYIYTMAEICTFSKNSKANLKNLGARRVTSSKFHTKNPHISCAWQTGICKSHEYGCHLSKSECLVFISRDTLQCLNVFWDCTDGNLVYYSRNHWTWSSNGVTQVITWYEYYTEVGMLPSQATGISCK
jgi:hypothetical protein